ncbi:uncharacterized protein [Solanum tuberosum]|uniref:uncharacterized protein n=1 Tax=Solanum tuberosum TaxID=4113 RepID=UPI00073A266E|nr:PREDICTED: uncharacterized protein LOC107060565 [Solanum tuberosum]
MTIGEGSNPDTLTPSAGGREAIVDSHHPLFLQACDTPGSSLVSTQLIGSENYSLWSRSMKIGLLGKCKIGFVDGSSSKEKFQASFHNMWEKCNAIVLSWIMISVSRELLSGIVYANSAQQVWNDLKERFDKVDGSRIFYLHKEIATLTQGILFVSIYFSRFKELWMEFDSLMPCPGCDCLVSKTYAIHFEYQRLMQFLIGLNESYNQCRSQIMMMDHVPSVNKAYSLVIVEESQRILGHTRDHCYKLHGYPSDWKGKKKISPGSTSTTSFAAASSGPSSLSSRSPSGVSNTGVSHAFMTNLQHQQFQPHATSQPQHPHFSHQQYMRILQLLDQGNGKTTADALVSTSGTSGLFPTSKWIFDSGASKHMVHSLRMLNHYTTLSESHEGKMYLPTGNLAPVSHIGSSQILGGAEITNMLHVPTFQYNLLSVPRLTKELKCSVMFYPNFCIFQDLSNGKVRGIGKLENDMYVITADCHLHSQGAELSSPKDQAIAVSKSCLLHPTTDAPYTVCPLAKQSRLSFPLSATSTTACFQLLHADVWGPYRVPTHDNNRLPSSILHNKTSYELLYLRSLSLDHLRVFACLAFASEVRKVDKFTPRAFPTFTESFTKSTPVPPIATLYSSLCPASIVSECPFSPAYASDMSATVPLRRSSRNSKPPIWLHDYVTTQPKSTCLYPLSNHAALNPLWVVAMQAKIKALEENHTWSITDLPSDKHPIGCKWVFKVKYLASGAVERY